MGMISRLGAADGAKMRRLNALFAEAFDDTEHYASNPPAGFYLEAQLANPAVIVLVAEAADGSLSGGLVAYELPKLEQARSEIYIYDLAVAESQRRQGIATALVARLRTIARERGAWVVYVQADYGDEPAIALYTKLGTREDVMHFDIAVGGKA
ncbi:AAC(3)-I family aminoglycoside N-acetyltransferase [Bradyrhizobium sp.]|uniref:AAC(3)-I family aminoglycoside N-acetyltransferase n=1 Tax=Bradyrhizobium sp. TaxID=376 RepID=UPI0025BBD2EA|nr:AAC(3)-I family aminoglycoside N-acetyltransferase [Bradyrhizobium sp.]